MTQAKKASYELYPMLTQKIVASERDYAGREAKGMNERQVLQRFAKRNPGLSNDHAFYIMAEELHLKDNGSQVIFPESPVVLDNLLKARFTMESHEGFDLPFNSFLLAMPMGYKYAGFQMPGLLVTWIPGKDFASGVLSPFLRLLAIEEGRTSFSDLPDMGLLSIVFLDRDSKGARSRSIVYGEDLPALLKAKNPEGFRDSMVRLGILRDPDSMDHKEASLQFYAMRLVASLGVYHLATGGKRLKPGYPMASAPKMDGKRPEQPVAPLTLSSCIPLDDLGSSERQSHFRTWHFRQLRDERFYRGEYQGHAHGSRYVFVSEAVVGLDATPSTQS